MGLVSMRRSRRRNAVVPAFGLTLLCLALFASQAGAELVYWENYKAEPLTIGYSNIDGSGGGPLNLSGAKLDVPEGMAIDSATGRLYVSDGSGAPGEPSEIVFLNLDGSGAGVFNPPGAEVKEPYGITIDPVSRTAYWTNWNGGAGGEGSIGWAKLDGSAAGVLNTAGATMDDPYKIALDPAGGRVFWANNGPPVSTISYANLNNTGGGNLATTGATPPESIRGLSVDPSSGRLYWLDQKRVSYASLAGGGGGDVPLTGATFNGPYGLALDPTIGRLYWANYFQNEDRVGAIGFVGTTGAGGGGINIATAPLNGAQDAVILKAPTGTGAPAVTKASNAPSQLACSQGSWAADFAGSFVYQAPRTLVYQWTRNGAAIATAPAPAFSATSAGSYACQVTAANQAGTASQTSTAVNVKAAKVKLSTKKKARVKAGGLATFKVKAANQGDLKSKNAKVCVKVPKKARKAVKAPKCKALGKVKALGKDSATLKLKVADGASAGTYKVTFVVRGSAGKSATAKIVVTE
jgi:hypothetical protein